MTMHALESLDNSGADGWMWTATCTCHNPDGEGVGRADFTAETPYQAVSAWLDHVAAQHDDIPEDNPPSPGKHRFDPKGNPGHGI